MNVFFKTIKNSLKPRYVILFVAIFGFIIWLGYLAQGSSYIQDLIVRGGYLGIFLFSIANGFNIIVPVIPASFLPAIATSGLDIRFVIFLFILGTTLADSVGFLLGRAGHAYTSKERKIVAYFEDLKIRYRKAPLIFLFFWAVFVPLPNEIILIPLGLLGYHARRVILIVFVGNTLFTIITSIGVLSAFEYFSKIIG